MNHETTSPGATRNIKHPGIRKITLRRMKANKLLFGPNNLLCGPGGMLQVIAITLNMEPDSYKLKARSREIVDLRSLAALLIRTHFPGVTLVQIANLFGGQDHSSIISGIERAKNLLYTHDEKFVNKYKKAIKSIEIWLERQASGYALAISA